MQTNINRRQWLRNSALLTGGLSVLPGIFNALSANYYVPQGTSPYSDTLSEQDIVTQFSAEKQQLKARLFANENPWGPSPAAKKAIADALATSYQYAFVEEKELSKKVAAVEGVQEEQILMAAGSSPLLQAAAIHFSKNGGTILTCGPTYDDLLRKSKAFGANVVEVPLTSDYKYDLDAIEAKIDSKTSLIYIVNPNNPTGTVLDAAKLKAFCTRVSAKVPIFIDEAYIDYLEDPKGATLIGNVIKGENIIVARTFSKLYGFAGLRVGYIVAQKSMIDILGKYSSEGAISAPTIAAAMASFKEQPYCGEIIKNTQASKAYLYGVLKAEGYDYIPSSTNFVMFPIKMDGKKFADEMMKRGVGLRYWKMNGKDYCRLSIGRMDEMEAFAKAFKEIS
ncbi:pyridoxal phosphate-dependent aminotransferase [Parasediminibacterium paludis]|uniref:Pyridoxal phosphate-dependent aminotransferase n=1 Tax=Parasediminibacterium paludis TaxID=908966 RepID=A0ABV8PY27_9BACT